MDDKPFLGTRELLALGAAVIIGGAIFFLRTPQAPIDKALADAKSALEDCRALSAKEYCYATYFRNLTTATDWHHAFDTLHALERLDPEANGCHLIAHGIARSETEKDPSKWRELMNEAPPECSYGAAHGALEVHAGTYPDGKLPVSEIKTACDNPDTHNCTHGLGHLLLVMTDRDIPASLRDCQSLPHDANGKFECLTGVFMEEITAVNLVEHGLAEESALNWPARFPALEALCRAQTGVNSVACWKEIAHVAIVSLHNDPQKVVDFCETAPGAQETHECINHSIGIIAAALNFDFARTRTICDARVKEVGWKERCYEQVVYATLSTLPNAAPEAERFCASLGEAYRASCNTAVSQMRGATMMNRGD